MKWNFTTCGRGGLLLLMSLLCYGTVLCQAPAITYFTPMATCDEGTVFIYGTNLGGTTAVSFGGKAANFFVVNSNNKITAQAGFGNTGFVSVTTPGGTATSSSTIIIPAPTVDPLPVQNICNGVATAPVNFSGTGQTYNWVNDNPSIGLAATGSGNIKSFLPVNPSASPVTATITVTPQSNQYALITRLTGAAGYGPAYLSFYNTQTFTIDSTLSIGAAPIGVAVNPKGNLAYVACYNAQNLSVIDINLKTIRSTLPVLYPWRLAINPDGNHVYITGGAGQFYIINTATNIIDTTIQMNTNPYGVAVLPSGDYIYIANGATNTVSVMNAATHVITATIPVDVHPKEVAVSTDGQFVYVSNYSSGTVSVINTSTNTVVATIPVGTGPTTLATNIDGNRLFVSNQGSNNVSVINTVTNTVTATIPVGSTPNGISVGPDGTILLVVCLNSIYTINPITNAVVNITGVNDSYAYSVGKFISGIQCYGNSSDFTISVNPTPVANVPANKIYCSGQITTPVTLTGSLGGVHFDISGGAAIGLANQTNVTAVPSFTAITGSAIITVTPKLNGCIGIPVTFTITVKPSPVATINPSGTVPVCTGFPVTLSANTGAYTYQWVFNGTNITSGGNGTAYITFQPGVYSVIVTSDGCPTNSAIATVVLNNCSGNSIVTQPLPQNTLCSGQSINVSFIANGTYVFGNRFRAQLSDANGNLANPLVVGEGAGTTNGTLAAFIPTNTVHGTHYRIRIVSDMPIVTGSDNGSDITINEAPAAYITPADSLIVYGDNTGLLTANTGIGLSYQWMVDGNNINPGGNNQTLTVTDPGNYSVIVTANGCSVISPVTKVIFKDCPPFAINVLSTNATNFSINVQGGITPYKYSLDGINFQASSQFILQPDMDYTIYVLDSSNCMQSLDFAIKGEEDCNTLTESGEQGTTFASQLLGSLPGTVVVDYDMLSIPDQMEIYYNNNLVATTDTLVSNDGWLTFNYAPQAGDPSNCVIKMYAPLDGTEWSYIAFCPADNLITMNNTAVTTCTANFVSPNFPGKYPANVTYVKTFTPASGGKLQVNFKAIHLSGSDVISVYDGSSVSAPLLGTFYGTYVMPAALKATNAAGQLTFKFVSLNNDLTRKLGWLAEINCIGPKVLSFSPQEGTTNTVVTISGSGFTGATAVKVGGVAVSSFTVLSDNMISAVIANGSSGIVSVVTADGTGTKDGFVYVSSLRTCPGASPFISSNITGNIYQWQVDDGTGYSDISDNIYYNGTGSSGLGMQNPPTAWYGNKYRCLVDGQPSDSYQLIFETTWNGSIDNDFETAGNWSCNILPDGNTDVIINGGDIILSSNQSVRSLWLAPAAKITAQSGSNLTITK